MELDQRWTEARIRHAARLAGGAIGGGAALSLLGATAAGATGDADATGNTSSTDLDQQLEVSRPAAPTVVELEAGVGNVGGGGANTGVNTGDGIDTGDASGSGNHAVNEVGQRAEASGGGTGPIVIRQRAGILNLGVALANTGLNDGEAITTGSAIASGNTSTSAVWQLTTVTAAGQGPLVVDQDAAIGNLGLGVANTGVNTGDGGIETGDAGASGNESTSEATQRAGGDAMAAAGVQQRARHRNVGAGIANTGLNEHTADTSVSDPEEEDEE